ncbi:MAG TPA: TIM barrel protein [Armatimonadota bacterium]|nr:TIM barrel protein [Armatimonadota bacterium]
MAEYKQYRYTAGPWNVHTGADPFGPPVRDEIAFADKVAKLKQIGYHGIQFHDDDVVSADADAATTETVAAQVKRILDDHGMVAEFVAPRLWEDPRTIDGAVTSNSAEDRKYALERSLRTIDIANMLGTKNIVLWPAREGTYIRESKDSVAMIGRLLDYLNALLAHDKDIRILGEMKPNEPMDQAYCPTVGHFIGLAYRTDDPSRVGALIESAHCWLAGLDPSEEMAYALWHKKLWGVHLNDQNGMKFDEDKAFGAVNLRAAFNQVRVLEKNGYGRNGEMVGFDVKAMRTQPQAKSYEHLANSKRIFENLLAVARSIDDAEVEALRAARDYEGLEMLIISKLMGR